MSEPKDKLLEDISIEVAHCTKWARHNYILGSSQMLGTVISAPEVTHVSPHGFWLLLNEEELLLPFEQFPWFRRATIDQLSHVENPAPEHLYWPELDIDLSVQSIRNPDAFPLVSKAED